jgi:hypothetical protein
VAKEEEDVEEADGRDTLRRIEDSDETFGSSSGGSTGDVLVRMAAVGVLLLVGMLLVLLVGMLLVVRLCFRRLLVVEVPLPPPEAPPPLQRPT